MTTENKSHSLNPIKFRFAPSPTGFLHVGGARTALFNYLLAKKLNGQFVLRIEDTDTERNRPEYEAEILRSMKWLGLEWDEGPFYQSKRFDVYRKFANDLVTQGQAYKCFCTEAEVEDMRKKAESQGQKPMYDRRCRNIPVNPQDSRPFCIRIKSPLSGDVVVNDLIKGEVRVAATELDDFVILRTNNTPTYNFTVVVDDVDMKITHVLRGEEHLNNTPKQLILFKALGFNPPQFAHVPLILAPDKTKLSKRHGAVAVSHYKELGFVKEGLINYLAKLGWASGDKELFTIEELKKDFSFEGLGTSGSVFDVAKLSWFNAQYLHKLKFDDLAARMKEISTLDVNQILLKPESKKLFEAILQRSHTLKDIEMQLDWYLNDHFKRDPELVRTILDTANPEFLKRFVNEKLFNLKIQNQWNAETITLTLKESCKEWGIKMPELAKPLRVALTGNLQSPDMGIVIESLGFERVKNRV
jgi:glutamyl-tRNA synthetase